MYQTPTVATTYVCSYQIEDESKTHITTVTQSMHILYYFGNACITTVTQYMHKHIRTYIIMVTQYIMHVTLQTHTYITMVTQHTHVDIHHHGDAVYSHYVLCKHTLTQYHVLSTFVLVSPYAY